MFAPPYDDQIIHTEIPHPRKTIYSKYIKRLLDVVLSGLAIIVLSPLFLVLCILELVYHGRPILYIDKRPGYHLVIFGVKNLFLSLTNGVQSLMGEMLARKEMENLRFFFDSTEWLLHTGTVFVFGCTGVLILPFVQVYTYGVTDANYTVPLFAVLITIAHAGHCLRLPYNILILAAGHYKQTQSNYIIAACLNIIISILTVRAWGLVGVAIGTLVAMLYQTVWMAFYDTRNILKSSITGFFKHLLVDVICVVLASLITCRIPMKGVTYLAWFLLAIVDALIWGIVILFINIIFYKEKVQRLVGKVLAIVKR